MSSLVKILVIQFRDNIDSRQQERNSIRREVTNKIHLDFIDASNTGLPWNFPSELLGSYQGVILGGSGEYYFDGGKYKDEKERKMSQIFLERLTPVLEYIFTNDLPTFGICYGHQILAAFVGVEVKCDKKQGKTGSHKVKLSIDKSDHFLFSGIQNEFTAHYGHKDVVTEIPPEAVLLACGGDKCKVSALQYKNNIYSTQFHPELTLSDMIERIEVSPGYLPPGEKVEDVFSDDVSSNKILKNFSYFVLENDKKLI